jgi:hypothetical protein
MESKVNNIKVIHAILAPLGSARGSVIPKTETNNPNIETNKPNIERSRDVTSSLEKQFEKKYYCQSIFQTISF